MSRRDDLECKVYVGDLPKDASERELERAFNYYGPIKKVWVAKNPPGFAFVEFEDPRDADDAVRALDDTTICGVRVRVEHSNGKIRPKPWIRGGRGFDPDDRCYKCGERGHYAYDCRRYSYSSRRRSRSRSPYSRSRRSPSYSPRRSRSRSPYRQSRSRSRSPYRRSSRDVSRSRLRSPINR